MKIAGKKSICVCMVSAMMAISAVGCAAPVVALAETKTIVVCK